MASGGPQKTKRSRRTLEVTPLLISKLPPTRWPAPLSRAGTPLEHGNVSGRLMARAVERAGLEAIERNGEVVEPAPTPHDLRHTHASRLIADGWDVEEISRRLGHSSVATTFRTYIHEFDSARRSEDRRRRLGALYGGSVEASMEAAGSSEAQQPPHQLGADVLDLSAVREAGQ